MATAKKQTTKALDKPKADEPSPMTADRKAKAALSASVNNASVIHIFQENIMGKETDLNALIEGLQDTCTNVHAGDLKSIETMLVTQAKALQTIFTSLARRAHGQTQQKHYESFLGLVIDKPKKALKTMAAIFTGKGKGSNREIDNRSNPIGFAVTTKRQTLCSVGFDQKQSPQGNPKVAPRVSANKQDCGMVETVRVRDSENDPAYFNPETGEFMKPLQTTRLNRAAADNWVAGALNQHN